MSDLTSWYFTIFTKCLAFSFLFILVCGAPTKELTLSENIRKLSCVFPPANLTIPSSCQRYTLSSNVTRNMHDRSNVEYYLCTALLDSVQRLCILVNGNKEFKHRVSAQLNDTLPNLMSQSDGDKFCDEMNVLDDNTVLLQAKFLYGRLKSPFCNSICNGLDEADSLLGRPICKSIQFAHQQIRTAGDLQKLLNGDKEGTRMDPNNAAVQDGQQKQSHIDSLQASYAYSSNEGSHLNSTKQASVAASGNQASHANPPNQPSHADSVTQTKQASESKPGGLESSLLEDETSIIHKPPGAQGGTGAVQNREPSSAGAMGKPIAGSQTAVNAVGEAPVNRDSMNVEDSPKNAPGKDPAEEVEAGDNGHEGDMRDATFVDDQAKPGEQTEKDGASIIGQMENGDNMEGSHADVADEAVENEENGAAVQDMEGGEEGGDIAVENKELGSLKGAVAEKSPVNNLGKLTHSPSIKEDKSEGVVSGAYGNFVEAEDSHFFAYFMFLSALCVLGYLVYHNKRKIIAMAVEGKKSRNTGRRRPNSASYHKLDSNLEEAMSSNLASTNSYVIY